MKEFIFPEADDILKVNEAILLFINIWYNRKETIKTIDSKDLPITLALIYSIPNYKELFSQNRLINKEKFIKTDNLTVFYKENQDVYDWAYSNGLQNPTVFLKENYSNEQWVKENESLAAFLYQVIIFEAIIGAKISANCPCCSEVEMKNVLDGWEKIPYGSWHWPSYPTVFYYKGNSLAVVTPNEREYSIWCGFLNRKDIETIKSKCKNDCWDFT